MICYCFGDFCCVVVYFCVFFCCNVFVDFVKVIMFCEELCCVCEIFVVIELD